MLSRDQILAATDIVTAEVQVPEWGGTITIRTLSGFDRAELMKKLSADGGFDDAQFDYLLLALSVVDEAGNRIFTFKDIDALMQKSTVVVQRVVKEIRALSGLGGGSTEDAEKN